MSCSQGYTVIPSELFNVDCSTLKKVPRANVCRNCYQIVTLRQQSRTKPAFLGGQRSGTLSLRSTRSGSVLIGIVKLRLLPCSIGVNVISCAYYAVYDMNQINVSITHEGLNSLSPFLTAGHLFWLRYFFVYGERCVEQCGLLCHLSDVSQE